MQPSYEKHNINDYIGKKYGHITVIGKAPKTNVYSNSFVFQCDCGCKFIDIPSRVINGHRTSCGKCYLKNVSSKPQFDIDKYIGKRSEMLTVIGVAEHKPSDKQWKLLCRCDCGNTTSVTTYQFTNGKIKSCGCLRHEPLHSKQYKDGRTHHPLYGTWKQMLYRCENPNTKHYDRYGGRGIIVCDEWHDFWKFVEWSDSVGGRPNGYSIDRINNDGNYSPENCRWANYDTQSLNKSSNRIIEYNGKAQTLQEWANELGINRQTLTNRINRGWNIEKAFTANNFVGNNQYTSEK